MASTGAIGNNPVAVMAGDITQIEADAYMIPAFIFGSSYAGVGGAVARGGGEAGLVHYDTYVRDHGQLPFGSALVTPSGGGNARAHIHVTTVGSGAENEFAVVEAATYNALCAAEHAGITSIAAPALGTGIAGDLEPDQSAKAMMAAIDRYAAEGHASIATTFVIFGSPAAVAAFTDVLDSGAYRNARPEVGTKGFDAERFATEQIADSVANGVAGIKGSRGIVLE